MKNPIRAANFLLPKKEIDLQKWAVIACDQHTSDPAYWESLSEFVGKSESALNLIFPEVYLEQNGRQARTDKIVSTMNDYLSVGIFLEYNGMVAIERGISNGKTRNGILLAVDLEAYSFEKGTKLPIRASEGTVLQRIPPRVAVRERCSLELPHIMLLYDDPGFTVQKAVSETFKERLYDFELNKGGGRIKGGLVTDCQKILRAFSDLAAASKVRYGEELLFAVGDGNHSLAAAKQVYENAKRSGEGEQCRYALCEAVNLYDEALEFEPIHRLVFAPNPQAFLMQLHEKMPADPIEAVAYTDALIQEKGYAVDYIHGTDHLERLANKHSAAAVFLKPMKKSNFFPFVVINGSLPKKTFSMGEAQDKRYYLEAAKIGR